MVSLLCDGKAKMGYTRLLSGCRQHEGNVACGILVMRLVLRYVTFLEGVGWLRLSMRTMHDVRGSLWNQGQLSEKQATFLVISWSSVVRYAFGISSTFSTQYLISAFSMSRGRCIVRVAPATGSESCHRKPDVFPSDLHFP